MALLTRTGISDDTTLKAVTRTEYVTMRDIAQKTLDSHGQEFVDEYALELTLGADLPITFASDKFEDNGYFKEPWEYNKTSNTTNISSGPTFYKTGAYKRKDIMGMRDSAIAYRKRDFDAAGGLAQLYRSQAIADRLHEISLDVEHDLVYGNPVEDPNNFLGLMPRHTVITDQDGVIEYGAEKGLMTPHITLDATQSAYSSSYAGSDISDNAASHSEYYSILLVVPSVRDGAYIITPDDVLWSAGINLEEGENWQDVLVTETDGKQHVHQQKFDKFMVSCGLAVSNRTGVIRIANVPVDMNADDVENLSYTIDQAYECLSSSQAAAARLYIPKYAGSKLRRAYRGLVQPATYDAAMPKYIGSDFSIDGHNFRVLQHLTTETFVS